jgi:steroid Delta-isomerase
MKDQLEHLAAATRPTRHWNHRWIGVMLGCAALITSAAAQTSQSTASQPTRSITTMKEITFSITGGYAFANPHALSRLEDGVLAQAGPLIGSWQMRRDDGKVGTLHVNAATAMRLVPGEAPSLMGTMELNMAEFEGSAPGSDALYLAYESPLFEIKSPTDVTITVKGRFVGGKGRYAGASGNLLLVSKNGFISDGRALVQLPAAGKKSVAPTETDVRSFVKRYFEGTRSMDAARWASAFAPTAVVRDPVAAPLLASPEAILKQGQGFVGAFREVGLTEGYVSVHGLQAVAHWVGRAITKEGQRMRFEGINHFEFDAQGRIQSLVGHWSPESMRAE